MRRAIPLTLVAALAAAILGPWVVRAADDPAPVAPPVPPPRLARPLPTPSQPPLPPAPAGTPPPGRAPLPRRPPPPPRGATAI